MLAGPNSYPPRFGNIKLVSFMPAVFFYKFLLYLYHLSFHVDIYLCMSMKEGNNRKCILSKFADCLTLSEELLFRFCTLLL